MFTGLSTEGLYLRWSIQLWALPVSLPVIWLLPAIPAYDSSPMPKREVCLLHTKKIIHQGKEGILAEVEVRDEKQRLLVKAQGSCFLRGPIEQQPEWGNSVQ